MRETGSERDMPLRLPWRKRDAVEAVRRSHGVSKVDAMILVALETEARERGRWVSYSRQKAHYAMPRRYRHPYYTYANIPRAFDRLDALGLIEHDRAPQGRYGEQSRARLTEPVQMSVQAATVDPPIEPLVLRDAQGRPIDYRDNRLTRQRRAFLEEYNERLRSLGFPPMVRIWNRQFGRGGRFYAVSGGWQSMRSEDRRNITIGGEPVVEIDYKAMHPSILYATAGARMPDDPYDVGDWPRPLVKVALLTLINAETPEGARKSLAQNDAMAEVARPNSSEAHQRARDLIRDVSAKHQPIADSFGADMGSALMQMDASVAADVMHAMAEHHGETVLPIHDSFLVRESAAAKLEEAMEEAAYNIVGIVIDMDRKGHAATPH